jgi:hypothetical protein
MLSTPPQYVYPSPSVPANEEITATSDDVYASYMQEDKIRNIISQTSPDNQLEEIEWRIKGYKKNSFTQKWEKINKDVPEPSPLLISRYISHLSSILNENTRFTNLSSIEINKIMRGIIEWLIDDMDTNAVTYDIGKEYTERSRICHIILNETFIVLKRSQNGMESRRIFSALRLAESLTPMPQKKGWLEALKFWKS